MPARCARPTVPAGGEAERRVVGPEPPSRLARQRRSVRQFDEGGSGSPPGVKRTPTARLCHEAGLELGSTCGSRPLDAQLGVVRLETFRLGCEVSQSAPWHRDDQAAHLGLHAGERAGLDAPAGAYRELFAEVRIERRVAARSPALGHAVAEAAARDTGRVGGVETPAQVAVLAVAGATQARVEELGDQAHAITSVDGAVAVAVALELAEGIDADLATVQGGRAARSRSLPDRHRRRLLGRRRCRRSGR